MSGSPADLREQVFALANKPSELSVKARLFLIRFIERLEKSLS